MENFDRGGVATGGLPSMGKTGWASELSLGGLCGHDTYFDNMSSFGIILRKMHRFIHNV